MFFSGPLLVKSTLGKIKVIGSIQNSEFENSDILKKKDINKQKTGFIKNFNILMPLFKDIVQPKSR